MPQRRGAPVSDAEALGRADAHARGIPHDRLERLRNRTPVVWLAGRPDGRPGSWAVLRYADVRYALLHPELFAPERDGVLHGPLDGDLDDGAEPPPQTLLDMDPPARAMLDRVPDGEPVDFVTQVAADLPETVRNTLGGGLHALLRHPAQYERLRQRRCDERLLDSAVEEMLRWWTPVAQVGRTVRRAAVLGGVPLLAGERVALWLASANHDEEIFPDPGRFVPERFLTDRPRAGGAGAAGPGRGGPSRANRRHQREQRVRPHLCFGHGDRACLGARLARVHLRALLVAILERPGRAAAAGEPVMLRSTARHGFERLPFRWTG
ncbi:cytochrome P450 [Actinomadura roseirufa]|uniref:cytochrome P450 n=1 Tax=Actinomadura roseirufa TaxID=2094049 RepID=UPI00104128CA|nr:cytochrome P450 [Actinomadura roseirufa]